MAHPVDHDILSGIARFNREPSLTYIQVVPFAPVPQGKLTYTLLPEQGAILPGTRVLVPLGHRQVPGIYVSDAPPTDSFKLKPVIDVLDPFPVFPPILFPIVEFASWYYRLPLGLLIKSALPPSLTKPLPVPPRTLKKLIKDLSGETAQEHTQTLPPLTPDQESAFDLFKTISGENPFSVQLLEGVTGSGKTRVYQEMILWALRHKKRVLVMTPEIGLTPPLLDSIRKVSPDALSIHSKQPNGERLRDWIRILNNKTDVVVGPRSAFFAPLTDLGLIIIDEEHDPSYQSREGLSYSVRSLAIKRAQLAGCPVILGSATPLLETWHQVKKNRYRKLSLPNRVGQMPLPSISVMAPGPRATVLPAELISDIQKTVDRGEKVILLLNRRGFVPALVCLECREMASCKNCSVHLVLHKTPKRVLVCHCCQSQYAVHSRCPACGGNLLAEEGLATQKLEEVIRSFFPGVPISRIDGDSPVSLQKETTSITGDILIGTQMIAKGHDFREVTLGIILETDRMLSLPDYRSEERAFELIIQLAGRVGRHLPGGRVVLITQNPKDKIFEEIITYDMERFFERTNRERLELFYPPHRKIALVSLWSRSEAVILEACRQASFERSPLPGVVIQGPVAAPVARAKGEFHYQFLIRAETITGIHQALDRAIVLFGSVKKLTINWSVDPPDLF